MISPCPIMCIKLVNGVFVCDYSSKSVFFCRSSGQIQRFRRVSIDASIKRLKFLENAKQCTTADDRRFETDLSEQNVHLSQIEMTYVFVRVI